MKSADYIKVIIPDATEVTLYINITFLNISLFLSFQDENAAAQSVLAVHGGSVRHFLPPLLQGPPLRLFAA